MEIIEELQSKSEQMQDQFGDMMLNLTIDNQSKMLSNQSSFK